MEQQIINEVKNSLFSRLPKWLRITLILLSIITMVYWLGFITYKVLSAIRVVGAFVFEKRNYWTFLVCILILVVGSLLVAQFYLDMNPFGEIYEWFIREITELRDSFINMIGGET